VFPFDCRTIRLQLKLKLGTQSIPALTPKNIQSLCTFILNKNTELPALGCCKESHDIAVSFYECYPAQTAYNRPPNLPTIYYHPLYDNIYLDGEAELDKYVTSMRLRPGDVKPFATGIIAVAASLFPGSPMKVCWMDSNETSK
jgi:hypothetical protein